MIFSNRGRMATGAVFAASLGLALTACGGSSGSSAASSATPPAASSPAAAGSSAGSTTAGVHTVSNSSLGTIVVNGKGLTLYRFDSDSNMPPKSNCSGQCAAAWPAAPASEATGVKGIDQKLLGSVTGTDGQQQLTMNGWPLYTFAQDSKPGDTKGQGLMGIWWAVTPTGDKAGAAAPSATTAPTDSGTSGGSSGGSYGY